MRESQVDRRKRLKIENPAAYELRLAEDKERAA